MRSAMAPMAPLKSEITLCPDDFSNCGISTAIAVSMAEPARILICAAIAASAVAMNKTEEIAAATAADDGLIMISSTEKSNFSQQASLENHRIKHASHDESARIRTATMSYCFPNSRRRPDHILCPL